MYRPLCMNATDHCVRFWTNTKYKNNYTPCLRNATCHLNASLYIIFSERLLASATTSKETKLFEFYNGSIYECARGFIAIEI
jgi:hypothetical protein